MLGAQRRRMRASLPRTGCFRKPCHPVGPWAGVGGAWPASLTTPPPVDERVSGAVALRKTVHASTLAPCTRCCAAMDGFCGRSATTDGSLRIAGPPGRPSDADSSRPAVPVGLRHLPRSRSQEHVGGSEEAQRSCGHPLALGAASCPAWCDSWIRRPVRGLLEVAVAPGSAEGVMGRVRPLPEVAVAEGSAAGCAVCGPRALTSSAGPGVPRRLCVLPAARRPRALLRDRRRARRSPEGGPGA